MFLLHQTMSSEPTAFLSVSSFMQADEYRHVEDNYQLYTMLMRFARCGKSAFRQRPCHHLLC